MGGKHSPGYIAQYERDNYDRISFVVPKGKKLELKQFADTHGMSLSRLIIRSLEEFSKVNLTD